MGRNIRLGDKGNIRFNLYGHNIANGKIYRNNAPKDRFYANIVGTEQQNKETVAGVIRSRGNKLTIETTSMIKDIQEDDFVENLFTHEIWKIVSKQEEIINTNSARPMFKRTLYLSR